MKLSHTESGLRTALQSRFEEILKEETEKAMQQVKIRIQQEAIKIGVGITTFHDPSRMLDRLDITLTIDGQTVGL